MTLSCSLWETFPTDVMFKVPPTVQFATWIILKKTHFLTVPLQVIHNNGLDLYNKVLIVQHVRYSKGYIVYQYGLLLKV